MVQWGLAKSFRAYMQNQKPADESSDDSGDTGETAEHDIPPHDRAREDVSAYFDQWDPLKDDDSHRVVRYMYPSPFGQEARTQLPLFENETGIRVQEQHTPPHSVGTWNAYEELLSDGNAEFDVGHIDVIWPGEFAAQDWAAVINDRQGHTEEMIETAVDAVTVDGDLVAMPFYTDVNVLFYNEKKLEQHGYTDPPTTDAELIDIAKDILASDDEVEHGFLWQGYPHEGLTVMWFNWLWGRGGTIWDGDRIVVNSATGIDALRTAVNLLHVHDISPEEVTESYAHDNRYTFAEGKTLFMRHWPKAVAILNDGTPVAGDFSVTTIPTHENYQGSSTGCLGGWNLFITRDAANRAAAEELIDWMLTEEVQRRLAIDFCRLPVRKSLYDDKEVREQFETVDVFEEALENSKSRPPIKGYPRLSEIIYTECHAALCQEKTPTEALTDAQEVIDEEFN